MTTAAPSCRVRPVAALLLLAAFPGVAFPQSSYGGGGAALLPKIFAEGVLTTTDDDLNSSFSPDGQTVYFSRNLGDRTGVILVSKQIKGRWGQPEVAPFSGQYSDYDPFVSPDGGRIFFISNRPADGKEKGDYDIWMVEKKGSGWGEAQHLPAPINTDAQEYYPSVTTDGTLYFSSSRPGGKGRGGDIYRSHPVDNGWQEPENLGDAVNFAGHDGDPYIAPDGSYVIWASYGRPDGLGDGDLYISYFRDGAWTTARPLGHGINSKAREYCPSVSPDGKWFYFTSFRGWMDQTPSRPLTWLELRGKMAGLLNGNGNVYLVSADALKE